MSPEETKKRLKAAKANHDLHVLLLMRQQNLSKTEATLLAYLDGVLGLDQRLSAPSAAKAEANQKA